MAEGGGMRQPGSLQRSIEESDAARSKNGLDAVQGDP